MSGRHVIILRLSLNDEVIAAIGRKLGKKHPTLRDVRKHFTEVIHDEAEFLFTNIDERDLEGRLERSVVKAKASKAKKGEAA